MMEVASTSETSVNFYQTTRRATTQKTAIFILAAVVTSNPTKLKQFTGKKFRQNVTLLENNNEK
jgi:hypothetical protein